MLSALISAYLVNTHRSRSLFHGYLEDRNLRHQNRAGIHRKIKWHEKPTTLISLKNHLTERSLLRHQNRAGIHRKIKWHEKPTTMTVYYPCGGNLWTVSNPFIIKAD
ncbi:unnamed protein product [Lepidochelys olivacea]